MQSSIYSSTRSQDAQAHGQRLENWEQSYEQLSTGPFEGLMEDLRVGPVQIFRESANCAVLQCGRARAETVSVGFLGPRSAQSWFCGQRLDDGLAIAALSHQEFELYTSAGCTLSAISVDLQALTEHAPFDDESAWQTTVARSAVLSRRGDAGGRLSAQLDEALKLAVDAPEWLAREPVALALAASLVSSLAECLDDCEPQGQRRSTAAARRRILRRAREYMAAHVHEVVTVPELCSAVGSSRRALQYAFEDALGLSPTRYLRMMRLNRTRTELLRLREQGGRDTVGDVAARWGFWHLPRFAAEYRGLFGELPSATRGRAPLCGISLSG